MSHKCLSSTEIARPLNGVWAGSQSVQVGSSEVSGIKLCPGICKPSSVTPSQSTLEQRPEKECDPRQRVMPSRLNHEKSKMERPSAFPLKGGSENGEKLQVWVLPYTPMPVGHYSCTNRVSVTSLKRPACEQTCDCFLEAYTPHYSWIAVIQTMPRGRRLNPTSATSSCLQKKSEMKSSFATEVCFLKIKIG